MFDFILAEGNLPFTVSIGLMLGIAVLEGILSLFGAGFSQALDTLLPASSGDVGLDMDLPNSPNIEAIDGSGADFGDANIAQGPEGGSSALSKLLGWLTVGKVPILILLVIFLTVYGLVGLIVQSVVHGATGTLLPGSLASIPALVVAVPSVRLFGSGLAKLVPRDESSAVRVDTFVGRVATITIGSARTGHPAEARVKDAHGQTHYVMVEPDNSGDVFKTGTRVLLIRRAGARFRCIENTSAALVDD